MIVSRDGEQVHIRVPRGMRQALADRASANGRAMNSEIVQILNRALREGVAATTGDQLAGMTPAVAQNTAALQGGDIINPGI